MSEDRLAPPSGWIILDKPLEMGSTQAVGAVKRNLREAGYAKTKVGHGGTLDPLATGVLPIAIGEATKLAGRMLDATKTYEFTIQFGTMTDTLDAEGAVIETSDRRPPAAALLAICEAFTGEIEQVPPKYSALKIDGRRAYDLARAGEDVEMKTRRVTIHALGPVGGQGHGVDVDSVFATTSGRPDPYDPGAPLELMDSVTLEATVSKGTYIRSLARDIAHALGTCGHVTYLRRTRAGPFGQHSAISLDKLNEIGHGARLAEILLPLEAGLDDIPALDLLPDQAEAVRQGRQLSGLTIPDGTVWAKCGGKPIALMDISDGVARVFRGFNI
ncbi:tRNA pseudouridine(55) synthase TruB [Croceicoccus marinus]|uniref:tRNA pseudouridine synthase B n=1 Tax=Croceicoccus marinus TaxID=450378 RepID=A0A1Z1FBS6_9SPHN|nr:tRNA pseudouridine(55) synthase TruB [Croceicoccus marinus]ARU16215.1 tRNA pseudouridine(55) synthase TruB [Croceicoccus marinus]